MNILLDSHALLWALHAPHKLRPEGRELIEDPANTVFYSVGSVWELEIKCAKGKLSLPAGWVDSARQTGFAELPIMAEDASASARLPWHHNDPFDRLFIAQAHGRNWRFATRDGIAHLYQVDVLVI